MYEGHTNSRSSSVRLKTWPRIDIFPTKDSSSLKPLLGGELFVQLCNPVLPKLEAKPALKIWGDLVQRFSLKMAQKDQFLIQTRISIAGEIVRARERSLKSYTPVLKKSANTWKIRITQVQKLYDHTYSHCLSCRQWSSCQKANPWTGQSGRRPCCPCCHKARPDLPDQISDEMWDFLVHIDQRLDVIACSLLPCNERWDDIISVEREGKTWSPRDIWPCSTSWR